MDRRVIIFFIILSSAGFFNVVFLPSRLVFLIQFAITVGMLLLILIQEIYVKADTLKHNFKYPVFLIFTGIFLSMIAANAYHGQNFGLTLWAQRAMYFYFFYFFLHFLKPGKEELEKIVLTFGILYTIFYLVQYAIYPTTIFNVRQDDARGTIRIFLPGASFLTLSLFLCLHRFYKKNQIKYIFLVITFLAVIILMATRNFLASVILVILYSLIFSKIIRSRYVIYFLILLSIIPIFVIFQDIFNEMIALSENQSKSFETDIRVRAATFFLTDFFPNKIAYIMGNGQDHGQSMYGMRILTYKIANGYYQSDIGIIGDFSKFGFFYVVGYLWLFIKVFTIKLKTEYEYARYFFLLNVFTMPFGSTSSAGIVALCILMYILDINLFEIAEEETAKPVVG